jgi:PKD repeat protein
MPWNPISTWRSGACAVALTAALVGCSGGSGGGGTVQQVGPPSAQIRVSTLHANGGASITAWAQAADPDGGEVSYAWDFDGDGKRDARGQTVTWTPPGDGAWTVRLSATDGEKGTARAEAVVTADAGTPPATRPPAVTARAYTLTGSAPFEVQFVAEASEPDGDPLVGIVWDLDGDGSIEPSATGELRPLHTYGAAGEYTATVTVTDNDGQSSSASVQLVLCGATRLPDDGPSAAIEVVSGGPLTTPTGAVELLAVGSDVDGGASTVTWQWDQDGDGELDTEATGRSVTLTALPDGAHTVRLLVTDDDGRSASLAEAVITSDGGGATTPAAWAFADAVTGSPGTPIAFHARAEDPDGATATLTYDWDLDNDGVRDATSPDPIHAYAVPGVYQPTVRVRDLQGNEVRAALTVVVEACPPATQRFAPHFWYDGGALTLYNGGEGSIALAPTRTAGSAPTSTLLVGVGGGVGACGDACGADLEVLDANNAPAPGLCTGTSTSPPSIALAGGTTLVQVRSVSAQTSHCVTHYDVLVRLEDPGVRIQVVRSEVQVIHGAIVADLDMQPPLSNDFNGDLDVGIAGAPGGGPPLVARPPVYGVELRLAEQTPAWTAASIRSPPANPSWSGRVTADAVFFEVTNPQAGTPLRSGDVPLRFEPDFTTAGGNPTQGTLRLLDASGAVVGRQPLRVTITP